MTISNPGDKSTTISFVNWAQFKKKKKKHLKTFVRKYDIDFPQNL